ncbi:hypothetical protein [Streptomyces sp. NPDC005374]|uniref:hypothetical protein n=1 Tax=Streptomyces sp. NPDC005374 TaxID=3364713 RepID=UPI0036B382E2
MVLDDRFPRDHPGRISVADADGRLDAAFSGLTARFVLVRPDRLIAAVFEPDRIDRVANSLHRFAPCPSAEGCVPAAGQHPERLGHEHAGQQAAEAGRPVTVRRTTSVSEIRGRPPL